MSQEKYGLTLNIPIGEMKPYKIVLKLKDMIKQVTNDFSYDDTYVHEINGKPHFAIVFYFYDKDTLKRVIELFNSINIAIGK